MKMLLALGAAAVALTAVPAEAKQYTNISKCTKYRHGRCVAWKRLTRAQARRAGYRVGYNFGPNYSYTDIGSLPQPIKRFALTKRKGRKIARFIAFASTRNSLWLERP